MSTQATLVSEVINHNRLRDSSMTKTFLDKISRWREGEENQAEPSEHPSSSLSSFHEDTNIKPPAAE